MADAEVELQQIGLYTVTSLLHAGSTSQLYTGKHRKKDIAIKVFRTPLLREEAKEAFLSRAKQLKKLKHRHILDILDFGLTPHFGTSDDYGYLIMQYAGGDTFQQRIAPGKRLSAPEVRPILSPVATALHYAHVSHIIHGNLHPGNLLYDTHNDILVSDFSLPSSDHLSPHYANPSAIPYMAPEQLRDAPTPSSDQYALAVMVYQWLCAQRPYVAAEPEALLHQQAHDPLPKPSDLNADISPTVEQVLLQALAYDPDDRFPHIQAFADNYLRALMGQPLQLEKKRASSSLGAKTVAKNDTSSNVNKTKGAQEDIADKDTLKMVAQQNTGNSSKITAHEDVDMHKKLEDPAHSTLYCRICGGANRTNAKYCFSCGQPILNEPPFLQPGKVGNGVGTSSAATLNCITCGATNRANANNCNKCGNALKIASPSTSGVITTPNIDTLAPNHLLNQRYRIISRLGQGGMGTVYKAKDTKFDDSDKLVAVKALSLRGLSQKEIAEATEASKQEAHILAGLRHPSLPRIYDHFNEGKHWYLVMDFIDGETLEDYLNRASGRCLPFGKVLYMGIQLCKVLEYLHNHTPPIIFRDLKPLNVMITPDGEHLYLIDFGIARHFKPGKAKDTTPLGTWGYAAPEQAGRSQTTHKSDIYSLGATLHQLLSGDDPAQNPFRFASLQLESKLVVYEFDKLIMQMLDMDPGKRPDSMTIIKQKLENIYAEWYTAQHNNQGSKAKQLVKASIITTDSQLEKTVSDDLGEDGILSQSLPGYEERLAQIEMAVLVAQSLTQNDPAIIEAATGTGKALDVDTPIPTPMGWKRMGDLVVGDFVFDEQGHPTRVMTAFDVMHDHTCYEVVFSDGSSIVADAEHEWASYTCSDRSWAKRARKSTYAAKNFITVDQLAMLDELIALSPNDDTLSIDEAVTLMGGHHWSVYQAAGQITPVNSGKRPAYYPHQTLLTTVRGRLERDLSEQRRDGREYTLVTTEKMATTLTVDSSGRANHAIPVSGPLVLPEADLPIAPYFLGAWLGDGSRYSNQITTADPPLITEIEKDGYTVRPLKSQPYLCAVDDENGKAISRWRPGMTGRLRALGLLLNKHIPAIYLRASEQQRRALLAGLLDTDGTVNHDGAVEFTTTNPRLMQDVHELMCSLGLRPSVRCGRAKCNGKDCGPKWTLAFTTDQRVFRLERKATAQRERLRNYSPERNRFRYVVAVREVPSRPVRCIQVEAQSHLYLAGRPMIPTHNSLAYLVPIVRSGKVAIISTANKALQEQLFYKDIPFIQQHIKPFEAALVKGVGNYVCIDRLESERVGLQFYAKNREFTRLVDITNDPDATFMGDFETLDFQLSADIRSKVCADSDQCAWSKCNYFADCYVRKMRVKAERAQVIVVNHTLLLLDAGMDGYLLPERDVIVLDEAHHLEEEATRSFTITVSPNSVLTLLAQRMLKDHSLLSLQDEANKALYTAWERLKLVADPGYKGRANLSAPLEEGLKLATVIDDLADSLRKQRPKNLPEKEEQLYDKLLARTQNLAKNIRTVFAVDQPGRFVYYVERVTTAGQRGFQLEVSASPLDVTLWLKEKLFDKCNVICTSATLATIGPNPARPEDKGPNFAYFRRRVGLDPADYPNVLERILPLTFDYESNALLYLPRDLPAPVYGIGSDDYTKAIAREMYRLVKISRGRAFLLFSSKRMLEQSYELMAPHLDYPLLRQGDMSRLELTRRFREEQGAILFGLKSFWEGVDIAGEALSMVVIDKLPFDPPDDPVHEARVAQMKAAGENWFGAYVLPQAVLRLKQGLGRLLRTREDRGVMAILDTRLHTKGYGKLVLDALPPAQRTASIKDVHRFFNEEDEAF